MTDTIPIAEVQVNRDRRQRRSGVLDSALQASISRVGLIHPIVVKKDGFILVAGERRLEACRALGWTQIPVRWMEDLSTDESRLIELEENLKRKELPWQDQVRAIAEIHQLFCERSEAWNQSRTAEALSVNIGMISDALAIAKQLDDPKVFESSSADTARNLIRRRQDRASSAELQEFAEFIAASQATPRQEVQEVNLQGGWLAVAAAPKATPALWSREACEAAILCEDFLKWAPGYTGPSFNLIHFDPPYGKNVFSGEGQFKAEDYESYDDQISVSQKLVECLRDHLPNLLSLSGHLVIWLDSNPRHQNAVMMMFDDILDWYPHPLIWHKSDNSGIVGDSQRWPRHTHESALLGIRGRRPLTRTFGDSYAGPGDRKLHPSCKPEPMLRHFFAGLVDEHTRLLDPTCGSGSALRAAESLGARSALGLESSVHFRGLAVEALQGSRLNRKGSKIVEGKI